MRDVLPYTFPLLGTPQCSDLFLFKPYCGDHAEVAPVRRILLYEYFKDVNWIIIKGCRIH